MNENDLEWPDLECLSWSKKWRMLQKFLSQFVVGLPYESRYGQFVYWYDYRNEFVVFMPFNLFKMRLSTAYKFVVSCFKQHYNIRDLQSYDKHADHKFEQLKNNKNVVLNKLWCKQTVIFLNQRSGANHKLNNSKKHRNVILFSNYTNRSFFIFSMEIWRQSSQKFNLIKPSFYRHLSK